MPAFQHVQTCCGVEIIYGFQETTATISTWFDRLEKQGHGLKEKSIDPFPGQSYVPIMVPGMYVIFLDKKQNDAFSKLLQQHGFELTKGPFKNPKMKNKTEIFMYTRINEYSWYEKFLTEEAKKVWKPQ